MLNLTNITIQERKDKNLNKYYLIFDKDTNNAYFCFPKALREGWDYLENYQNIKEVELEYEVNDKGNNKVVSLFAVREEEIIV